MKLKIRPLIARRYILVAAFLGLAYLIGYLTAEHALFPSRYIARAESLANRVIAKFVAKPAPAKTVNPPRDVDTIFVTLHVEELAVPISRNGEGGGLTSVGDELLLLGHEGSIFLVRDDAAQPTRIAAPANGFDDYVAAAESDKYKDLDHKFVWFRYHDILHYSEPGSSALVVSYTEYLADSECYGTAIARLELPPGFDSVLDVDASAADWTVVYRTQPCLPLKKQWRALEGHMAGGRIAYRAPHKIILGNGDYHWDGVYAPESFAQRPDNDYGKVLEVDLQAQTAKIVSLGNRNMQGVLVDDDGQIWVTEHGPRGGDELNRIVEGNNYGWPKNTLGTEYNLLPWPGSESYGRHDQFARPVYAWVPSVATSGLTQVHDFTPSWDGDLLVATLRSKSLYRLRIMEDRVLFAEPIIIGERIRYVHQHSDGRIVLWTDARKLLFVTLGSATHTYAGIEKFIAESDYDAPKQQKLTSAIESCAKCHSFDADVNVGAPALGAIYEGDIAATAYAGYSPALRSMSGQWTAGELSSYLSDPQAFAPGTTMPDPGIDDPAIIDGIVEILRHVRNEPQ